MLESDGNKPSSFLPQSSVWNISSFTFNWDRFFSKRDLCMRLGMFMSSHRCTCYSVLFGNGGICANPESMCTTRAVSMHTVCMHANTHTLEHTHTRCGVLSLCGPLLGCGVKQEMCEPWRHVFMLAAVAHHQPEGKQTPAPLRLLSFSISPSPSLLLVQALNLIFSRLWLSKISPRSASFRFIFSFPSRCFSSLFITAVHRVKAKCHVFEKSVPLTTQIWSFVSVFCAVHMLMEIFCKKRKEKKESSTAAEVNPVDFWRSLG